jgi:hypothetical protein
MAGTEQRVFSARRAQYRFRQFSPAQTLKGNMISDTASWSVILYVCTLEDHSKHLVGQSVGEQTSYAQLGCTKMTKFRHYCSTLEKCIPYGSVLAIFPPTTVSLLFLLLSDMSSSTSTCCEKSFSLTLWCLLWQKYIRVSERTLPHY